VQVLVLGEQGQWLGRRARVGIRRGVEVGRALEIEAQLCSECHPDRLVQSAPTTSGKSLVSVVICRRPQKD
jgi:hypothetical protein